MYGLRVIWPESPKHARLSGLIPAADEVGLSYKLAHRIDVIPHFPKIPNMCM